MKVTVIGAGNMGGAIARGMVACGVVAPGDMTVSDPSQQVLDSFRTLDPAIRPATGNAAAVQGADLVVVAVKPWLMEQVCREIAPALDPSRQSVASIVAGVTFAQMAPWLGYGQHGVMWRIIPNTAIALGRSVTFIAPHRASPQQLADMQALFEPLGRVFTVGEEQMTACTALASCGIAYALRYIDAAARGGDMLGVPYPEAQQIVMQTLRGALALLDANESIPQAEIDKVTTPGGITLRGLEEMERSGFSEAVINGLKASK